MLRSFGIRASVCPAQFVLLSWKCNRCINGNIAENRWSSINLMTTK